MELAIVSIRDGDDCSGPKGTTVIGLDHAVGGSAFTRYQLAVVYSRTRSREHNR